MGQPLSPAGEGAEHDGDFVGLDGGDFQSRDGPEPPRGPAVVRLVPGKTTYAVGEAIGSRQSEVIAAAAMPLTWVFLRLREPLFSDTLSRITLSSTITRLLELPE